MPTLLHAVRFASHTLHTFTVHVVSVLLLLHSAGNGQLHTCHAAPAAGPPAAESVAYQQTVVSAYAQPFTITGTFMAHPFTLSIPRGQSAETAAESLCLQMALEPRLRWSCRDALLERWKLQFEATVEARISLIQRSVASADSSELLSSAAVLYNHARILQRRGFHEEAAMLLHRALSQADSAASTAPAMTTASPSVTTAAVSAVVPDRKDLQRALAYALMYSAHYQQACDAFRLAHEQHSRMNRSVQSATTGRWLSLPPLHPSEKVIDYPLLSLHRLVHDTEQLEHLLELGLVSEADALPILSLYRDIFRAARGNDLYTASRAQPHGQLVTAHPPVAELSDAQWAALSPFYNRRLHLGDGSRLHHGSVLNPGVDWAAVQSQYLLHAPHLVVVDAMLSSDGLLRLRHYLQQSTIWNVDRVFGYLGAYVDWGMEFELLFQLVEELHAALPQVLCRMKLTRAWAYKYDTHHPAGLNLHADAGAVTFNFWLTDDAANNNPDTGGLVVYHAAAPSQHDFSTYNVQNSRADELLRESHGEHTVVPHRANRLLLFQSDLLHKTDSVDFQPGYTNRRISVTLLFGRVGERCGFET